MLHRLSTPTHLSARFLLRRNLASVSGGIGGSKLGGPTQIFDRQAKRLQKDRAAADPVASREVDYLRDETARQLVDRLLDIKRRFPTIVELGANSGYLRRYLSRELTDKVIQCDMSEAMLRRDEGLEVKTSSVSSSSMVSTEGSANASPREPGAEEEEALLTNLDGDEVSGQSATSANAHLPPVDAEYRVMDEEHNTFAENSLDAVVSNLSLHWVNDLPGALIQIQRSLRPDGMFLGAMLGGDTLFELRTSLQLADLERRNGIAPRISPMVDPRDMTDLLARAGFALTTVDVDEVVIDYPSPIHLMQDLQAMGESNAVLLRRDTLLAASSVYQALHGNEDGTIPATFQVVFMIGWKPDPSQPKPKKRGSATVSLKDALK
ncbi:hypothetical protein IWQ60_002309 [Tieghemiomyces parasiticus]|uniref:S-adenosyl-L-methionine-dependent methyltransferase n=1 Tax=Tieghemiomyces parasiticus TaxID=78921 RepID=A0A9W8AJ85_9FUNG|nr:hypothetical protein IWQ60_002309 [Tieghemiomyces parasiticus]